MALAVLGTVVPLLVYAVVAFWRLSRGGAPLGDVLATAPAAATCGACAGLQIAMLLFVSDTPAAESSGSPARPVMIAVGLVALSLPAMAVSFRLGLGLAFGAVALVTIARVIRLGDTIGALPATLLSLSMLLGLGAAWFRVRHAHVGFEWAAVALALALMLALVCATLLVAESWRDVAGARSILSSPEFATVARAAIVVPVWGLGIGAAFAMRDMEDPVESGWTLWLPFALLALSIWLIADAPRGRRLALWFLVPCLPVGVALLAVA